MKGTYTKSEHFEIVDTIGVPHTYCITPRHVEHASDKFNGRLGEEAIRSAEKIRITCGVRGCQLSFDQHEHALLIACEALLWVDGDVNPELEAFMKANLAECEKNGYAGFSFLDKGGEG